jgi:MerR family transcriptional regulator, mercuric resistance operon regulatory protein
MARSAEFHIGELSRQTGCNVETIRYYERIGLLPRPSRSTTRYRIYDTADVRRLAFVRRARELGFTLDEVRRSRPCRADRASSSGSSWPLCRSAVIKF